MIAREGAGISTLDDVELTPADRERARALARYLRESVRGAGRAVNVETLGAAADCSPRKVRTLVTALRTAGEPVLATPNAGYYWPATREEAEHTLAFLDARIEATKRVRAGIARGLDHVFGEPEQMSLGGMS